MRLGCLSFPSPWNMWNLFSLVQKQARCWAALPGRREHFCHGQNDSCSGSAIAKELQKAQTQTWQALETKRRLPPQSVQIYGAGMMTCSDVGFVAGRVLLLF